MNKHRAFLLDELRTWGERRDKAVADGDTQAFQIALGRVRTVWHSLQIMDATAHDAQGATD
jgi:hypothetical protein